MRRNRDLNPSSLKVAIAVIKVKCYGRMNFRKVGPKPQCFIHRRVTERTSLREGADWIKAKIGRDSRATNLASRCDFWFHGPKSFVEKTFGKNYNSSLASVYGFVSLVLSSFSERGNERGKGARLSPLLAICTSCCDEKSGPS